MPLLLFDVVETHDADGKGEYLASRLAPWIREGHGFELVGFLLTDLLGYE